jgi:hypothetical protein
MDKTEYERAKKMLKSAIAKYEGLPANTAEEKMAKLHAMDEVIELNEYLLILMNDHFIK